MRRTRLSRSICAALLTVQYRTPNINNVVLPANYVNGSPLLVTYVYEGSEPQVGTTYQWYRDGVAIAGATANSYTPDSTIPGADYGVDLTCEVTPSDGINIGTPVLSSVSAPTTNTNWTSTVLQSAFNGVVDSENYIDETGRHTLDDIGTTFVKNTFARSPTTSVLLPSAGGGGVQILGNIPDFTFGTGDFTIEIFTYQPTGFAVDQIMPLISMDWVLFKDERAGQNNLRFQSTGATILISAVVPDGPRDQWNHFAISRVGTDVGLYANGVRVAQVTSSFDFTAVPAGGNIGNSGGASFRGYVDDVRILKGVGLYSGPTITIPTTPFPGQYL
jgi:hypothetical protein